MKAWSKFAIVLSGGLFAAGIAATAAGIAMGGTLNYRIVLGRGYQSSAVAQDWTTTDLGDYDGFQSYALEVQDAEVQVLCDPACGSPYLKTRLSKSTQLQIDAENGLLRVTTDSSAKGASYMGFRFDFPALNLALDNDEEALSEQLILCLPENDQRGGIIKSSYGDITVSGGNGDLTIDAGDGDVTISDRKGGNLTASLDYCDFTMSASEFTVMKLVLKDGSMDFHQVAAQVLTADLNYGSADLRQCTLDTGRIYTHDGNLFFDDTRLADALELKSDYGNITLKLPDGPEAYSLNLSAQNGTIQVGGKEYDGTVLMERQSLPVVTAETYDGNIEVS